jgi:hypothetical protein
MIVGSCRTRRKEAVPTNLKINPMVMVRPLLFPVMDALAVFAACVSRDNKWILDTAALFRICCNKDWFSDTHVDQCQVGTNHGEKFNLA